jgi:hypothetical protein
MPALMDDKESTSLRLRLRRIARTPIRSVPPETEVKIRGRLVLRGPALPAPVTGTPCALYCLDAVDTSISLHLGGEELPPEWNGVRLPREIRGLDLLLDDGTARALVRIDGAQISMLGNWMTSSATTRAQFLSTRGHPPTRSAAHSDAERYLEYRELKIVPGELVTILGRADYGADPDAPASSGKPAYRASHHRCVFIATATSPLYIIQERVAALDAVG